MSDCSCSVGGPVFGAAETAEHGVSRADSDLFEPKKITVGDLVDVEDAGSARQMLSTVSLIPGSGRR